MRDGGARRVGDVGGNVRPFDVAARFEQDDVPARVFAETRGENGARRASADDERVGHRTSPSSSVNGRG